jgi:TIR domain
MTGIAIVVAGRDAPFAEEVRSGLKKSGHEASLSAVLPQHPASRVVLIWSAALEAAHAVDAQALIGLWSEGRLLVVRRDSTPLPLGLRDLPSKGPETSAADVCAEFASAAPAASSLNRLPKAFVTLAAIVLLGGGAWYYFNKSSLEKQAALTAALETATKAAEELKAAQSKQLDALKVLEQAREAEAKARAAGDVAALKKAQEASQRAEEEAKKQAALVKAQEEKATKAREDLKKSQDAAKSAKAEPQKQEIVAAVAPKAEAPKKGPLSRSERERLADEEAARKALEKAGRAPVASQESTQVAAAPAAPAPAKTASEIEDLYQQALAMEDGGNAKDAIRIYRRAARAGSGKAAKRLGEIYDRGVPGVSRDYAESLQWYETARQLGETVELAGRRESSSPPETATPGGAQAPKLEPKAEPEAVAAPKPVSPPVPVAKPRPPVQPKVAVPLPAPKPAPVVTPEPPKASEPAPPPAPVAAVPEPAPEKHKSGSWRFALIAVFVLAIVFWRRARKRRARATEVTTPESAPAPAPVAARRVAQPPADATTLFVSYSHKDRPRVEPIVSVIEAMGRRVWMDRTDITGQTGWAGQIVRAIRDCRAVVLMASPNSYGSDQVVRELYLAMNHKKTIVPIEIEPADLPDELQYILAPFQHHRLSGGETREVLGRALAAV